MKKLLPYFIIGAAVWFSYLIISPAFGATILYWNATDTISNARTNINTTFDNLNSAISSGISSLNGSTSSTQTFAGSYIGISTTNGVHTFTNNGVQTFNGATGTITGVSSISVSSTIGATASTGTVSLGAKFYPIQFIIESPTASENDGIFIFRATSTINSCLAVNKTLGDTVTFGLGYGSDRSTASSSLTQVISGTTTAITATTTPTSVSLNNTTPGNNNHLIFYTTAASSSQFTLSCFYSEQ